MEPRYDIKEVEERIYKLWEKSGFFNPDKLKLPKNAEPFSIIMPPTNANGSLHAGHGLVLTIEDIMTRYKRMRGYKTLWLPGLDHAGFETQVVYEKQLEKEGRSRFQMDRQQLFDEISDFTKKNKQNIENQTRRMGASCDWSREKFTLDKDVVETVYSTFEKLYKDGLVYRGKKIVNWCPKHQTSLSDLETADVEQKDTLYYLKYGPFTIATARPETKFGDKYVVMHPDDKRYQKYKHGEKFEAEWINGKVTATVIKDKSIDMKFGTGVMTITPWHDAADFEIAERHSLDKEQVIDLYGKLMSVAQEFAGMKIKEAREKIIEKLKTKNLVERVDENYSHVVKTCYKCGSMIEPQIREQWFVKMKPLAEPAIKAIKAGKVKFIPSHYKKISLHWLNNILDWNISRQIVWGIRIPAWFCLKCNDTKVNVKVKSKWFLVRHGETDANKNGIIDGGGEINSPLNENGRRQAEGVAKSLKGLGIDLVISSDLLRAKQTAEIISKEIGAEVIFDSALRERHWGEYEGKTFEEANVGNADRYKRKDLHPKGGENWEMVEDRIWKSFLKHRSNHRHKNIVIVSHGGAIRMLRKKISDLDHDRAMNLPSVNNAGVVSVDISEKCRKCGGDLFEQDTDVFDTWFSSGQWPFASLGYPKVKDFKTFYPTSVMETAGEIIFFWVARMIMFGLYVTKKVPFETVYLHGLVLDANGKKMSKSRGNVINPLDITEKYGTDALRIGLVIGNTPGTSLALNEDRIKGYRNFSTKIWNVARFVLMNEKAEFKKIKPILSPADKKDLLRLKKIKTEVTKHLDKYEFHLAGEKLYHYFWHEFADKIVESSKPRLAAENTKDAAAAYAKLEAILKESLIMLHPFIPFVTEEIWQKMGNKNLLMVEKWPSR